MSRYRTLLSLGALVLVVGLASLIVTGAVRRAPPPRAASTVPATPSPFPLLPIPPFPTPPSCTTDQLELVGVFNDCAGSAASGNCSVSGSTLRDVLYVQGKTHGYLLYLTIVGYHGPGVTYVDVSVLVRESVTGALWQSTSGGIIRVTGVDGRSGSVKAELAYVGGEPTPPTVGLDVSGGWRCA